MRSQIRSWRGESIADVQQMDPLPERVRFPLGAGVNRCKVASVVNVGAEVAQGAVLAQGEALTLHASVSGRVEKADAEEIVIRRGASSVASSIPRTAAYPSTAGDLVRLAREMGLVGMGGSMFPASLKLGAARQIHTLVVNAVECEPGVQIDEALLLQEADTVRAGVECVAAAFSITRRVIAVKCTSARRVKAFAASYHADVLPLPNIYPGGAEKLIVARLDGRMPPAGQLPVQLGYLVFSVASLWALGRWFLKREPSILRPLSLVAPPVPTRNVLAPIGTPLSHIMNSYGIGYDAETHLLVTGGLMMGRSVTPDTPVLKGTTALFVQPIPRRLTRPEGPCILCGACFDVCPLKLHPSIMAERIRDGRRSAALEAHLDECFLCGACSAVCPSEIPLVQVFRNAKRGPEP